MPENNGFGKNIIISRVDNSSSVHTDNSKKNILIIGKGPTDGLDDTAITAEVDYFINFTEQQKKSCLSLHFNGSSRFLLSNGVKTYQFKAKNSETNASPFCLRNIS